MKYFSHRDVKNFRRNFRDFAATFDLETEYTGARQREAGKSIYFTYIFMLIVDCVLTFPSLVISEGEEDDDADHNAENVATANDNDDNDDNDTTMPPKSEACGRGSNKETRRQS